MPKLQKTGNTLSLPLNEQEAKALELEAGKDYEIIKARKGLYVLLDSKIMEEEFFTKVDEKIYAMLEKSAIQDRVEEKFESFLNHLELSRFDKMLKDGKVEKFKASEKYKKAVYRLSGSEVPPAQEKHAVQVQGAKGLFVNVKTEQQARELNDRHWKELKEGALKGLKDFDNNYYLIDSEMLAQSEEKVLNALKQMKAAGLEELSARTGIAAEMLKGVCAFLKEDGEILERKKGTYSYIP